MQHLTRLAYVWLGAAVFVGSLLYFLYFYLIQLDRPATPGGVRAFTLDVALFSVFALHHSVMARSGAKRWISHRLPAQLERSTYSWIASLLFFAVCAGWQPIDGVLYEARGWLTIPFRTVQVAAVVLILNATAALDALELAGVRQVQRRPAIKKDPLATSGLYGVVRHPVYLGWMLFVLAAPRMTVDRAVFAIISVGYLALAVPFEERSLVETFGDTYRGYASKVRWKIVPWIY